MRVADLRAAAERVEEHLNRKLARLASPYLRGRRSRCRWASGSCSTTRS